MYVEGRLFAILYNITNNRTTIIRPELRLLTFQLINTLYVCIIINKIKNSAFLLLRQSFMSFMIRCLPLFGLNK